MPREFIFKIVLVGNGASGKTSLVLQYTEHKFSENYIMSIGANFAIHLIQKPEEDIAIRLQLWDLAGQKFFQRVRKHYYHGAKAAFIMYDTSRRETFDNRVEFWYNDLKAALPDIPIVIIGNKIDLTEDRQVTPAEGEALAKKLRCSFLETSALSGENVKDAFSLIGIGLIFQLQSKTTTQ